MTDLEQELTDRRSDINRLVRLGAEQSRYAVALRSLVIKEILDLSKAGFQGSADKLEDALDRVDAMAGAGPYATNKKEER